MRLAGVNFRGRFPSAHFLAHFFGGQNTYNVVLNVLGYVKSWNLNRTFIFLLYFLATIFTAPGQMVTGFWKGRLNHQKVEVKLVLQGDSVRGTSYYYESASNYRRYSIRGYVDQSNEVVWWDDQLIEEKSGKLSITSPGRYPSISYADFNCPGSGKMMLDGKSGRRTDPDATGETHLVKVEDPQFLDEWDYVIDNYTYGANTPEIIDSVGAIAFQRPAVPALPVTEEKPAPVVTKSELPATTPPVAKTSIPQQPVKTITEQTKEPVATPVITTITAPAPLSIEEKFNSRKKQIFTEIPLTGDSIELRFYDHGEIDGDSISLFLNNELVFQHIRLAAVPYTIKLATADLKTENELTMVAENLGTIPPNTSLMIAVVGEQRYTAHLESTEGTSAVVRLTKPSSP